MSSIAGITPGHAVTAAPNPPAPFVPGDALFNIVITAVPYQALVGDYVLTTGNSVTTPIAPTDGEYFAIKNRGASPVTVVGTVDGVVNKIFHPSEAQPSTWFVYNATNATWEIVADYDPLFTVVVVAAPYQAIVGDFVITSSNSVTAPASPTNRSYFAVKNVGSLPVTVTGTIDGVANYVIHPAVSPAPQPSVWFVYNATSVTWEVISAFDPNLPLAVDTIAAAGNYNFALTDANNRIKSFTNAAAKTGTVLNEATVGWKTGTILRAVNLGAGQLSAVAGAGVTIRTPETLIINQYAQFTLTYLGGDVWDLAGNLVQASQYRWTWPDAATRVAQSVVAADIGFVGFQTDIGLRYQLLAIGPSRWGPLADPSMGILRNHGALINTASAGAGLITMSATQGALAARGQTTSNALTRLARVSVVSGGGAGSSAVIRPGVQAGFAFNLGFRFRTQFGLAITSANMWWFVGFGPVPAAGGADPVTFLNCFGVGRSATDANVQLFHNDGAGAAVKVDLGASFPAVGTDIAWELELYSADGSTFAYQLTYLNTGAVISGTFNTDVPTLNPIAGDPIYYAANNTDAVAIDLCYANLQFWQRTY